MKYLLALLCVLGLAHAHAQMSAAIRGKVMDGTADDEPIMFANVQVLLDSEMIAGAQTDFDGNFYISNIPAGCYSLKISHVGYPIMRFDSIRLVAGMVYERNVRFTSVGDTLEMVFVEGERPIVEVGAISNTLTLTAEDISPRATRKRTTRKRATRNVADLKGAKTGVAQRDAGESTNNAGSRGSDNSSNRSTSDDTYVDGVRVFGGASVPATEISEPVEPQREIKLEDIVEELPALDETGFIKVAQTAKSTFSIDVDNAAYTRIRQSIENKQMPNAAWVRLEEMINYFNYKYTQPTDNKPFAVHTDISKCPWNPQTHLVRVALRGRDLVDSTKQPSNFVFLIDVSGSMYSTLPMVRDGLKKAVQQLAPTDKIAIVVYAGAAGLVLPSTPVAQKQTILDAIDKLESGGSTAGGAGIKLAYRIARENYLPDGNNRVILCTDGDFNVGTTQSEDLLTIIKNESQQNAIFLTGCAVGATNAYNDAMLEKITNAGNGNYFYLDNEDEAERVFVEKLTGNLHTIAKDVKIQIAFNKNSVLRYKLIGYDDRRLENKDFRDDKKDAGELGAGHTVTAFYEVELMPTYNTSAPTEILTVALRYKEPKGRKSTEFEQTFIPNAIQDDATMTDDFRFAAGVICFGEYLRTPKQKNMLQLAKKLAKPAANDDMRKEFIKLIDQCSAMR